MMPDLGAEEGCRGACRERGNAQQKGSQAGLFRLADQRQRLASTDMSGEYTRERGKLLALQNKILAKSKWILASHKEI